MSTDTTPATTNPATTNPATTNPATTNPATTNPTDGAATGGTSSTGMPASRAITTEPAELAAGEAQPDAPQGRTSTASWIFALVVYTWLATTALMSAALNRTRPRAGDEDSEEGSILSEVAFIVGLVVLAGVILLAVRSKATTLTNNICTNADPTTC